MKILLTNDDGIYADGILSLYRELSRNAEVVIVAPEGQQSAVGHAISIADPIKVNPFVYKGEQLGYMVGGTPADCVKLGIAHLLPFSPDLVISGINLGMNAGDSVIYSGTVSAATEGSIQNIPSLAVSLATYEKPDYSFAAPFAAALADIIKKNGLPAGTLLNVNIPAVPKDEIRGMAITKQARFTFKDRFHHRTDPRGRQYFWLDYEGLEFDNDPELDIVALKDNRISITPLTHDLTDYSFRKKLDSWVMPELDTF
ncbi:MAG: 5'/3'-nucleotidase SurE [bacterium]